MDLKGIAVFLALTFGVGYALMFGGLYSGLLTFESESILHTLLIVLLVNAPGLFAFIAGQMGNGPVLAQVFPLPRVAIVRVAVLAPVVVVLANLIAVACGFSVLDWRLGTLMNILQEGQQQPLSKETLAVLPAFLIVAGTLFSIILGATLVAACVVGQVYAWHVYLQERLAPLGRWAASGVGGALWAVWFAPLVYASIRATGRLDEAGALGRLYFLPIGGILMAIILTAIIRQAYERSGSLSLAAVVLGSFTAHAMSGMLSIWGYLFQVDTPPWTGVFGVISVALWGALAAFPGVLVGGKAPGDAQEGAPAAAAGSKA